MQQLAVNDQALRQTWASGVQDSMSIEHCRAASLSADISCVSCSWGQRAAAGGERQLAVNAQALRQAWEMMSTQKSKIPHLTTDISNV